MATISVGLSRKVPGDQRYSSEGVHVGVEVDVGVDGHEEFHSVVKSLFREVETAIDAEVARRSLSSGRSAGHGLFGESAGKGDARTQKAGCGFFGETRTLSSRGADSGGNGPEPITNKQAAYLRRLARDAGMKTQADVGEWLGQTFGAAKELYGLTRSEASKAISALSGGAK